MESTQPEKGPAADFRAFMQLLWPGPLVAQAICTAAKLKLAGLLADSPMPLDALAASASARPKTLERLLKALSRVGLFSIAGNGQWPEKPLQ